MSDVTASAAPADVRDRRHNGHLRPDAMHPRRGMHPDRAGGVRFPTAPLDQAGARRSGADRDGGPSLPTGALAYSLPDGVAETADVASIRPAPNGPLYVRGEVQVQTEDGRVIATGVRMALCRCGATKNAPFCDGSHRAIGFTDG